jgi:hypothetical protein
MAIDVGGRMFVLIVAVFFSGLYLHWQQDLIKIQAFGFDMMINPTWIFMILAFFFFLGIALSLQFFSVRQFFVNFYYYRAQRQRDIQAQQSLFYQQALEFLFYFTPTTEEAQKLSKELKNTFYKPKIEFKKDTFLWGEAIKKEDFFLAYEIVYGAAPFLPKDYLFLWQLHTAKRHLCAIKEEKELRQLIRKMQSKFLEDPKFLLFFSQKLSLFSSKQEALEQIQSIHPKFIDEPCFEKLFSWMRQNQSFWEQALKKVWKRKDLSYHAELLYEHLSSFKD